MKVVKDHCTKFKRYGEARSAKLDSIQVHSIGAAQNTAKAVRDSMNQYNPGGIVHAVVDAETEGLVLELLPDNNVAWADAGYGNQHSYTFEIAESDSMRYENGSAAYQITDEKKFLEDINRGYRNAVEFAAAKCSQFGISPMTKLSNGLYALYSHDEGRLAGVSSAHVDPTHVWTRIGKTMDDFRRDVTAAMEGEGSGGEAPDGPLTPQRSYVVQAGAFEKKSGAVKMAEQLKAAGFEALVKEADGYYLVQAGVFSVRENALRLAESLKNAGFEAFVKS